MKLYWLRLLLIGLVCVGAHADDTEIYLGNPNAETVKPNIVFIFDTSGSMRGDVTSSPKKKYIDVQCNWWGECSEVERWRYPTRLELTQKAAIDTINSLSGVNLALMQFNIHDSSQHRGGFFELPMKSIDDSSHKENIISKIEGFTPVTWTPIVETVHEAYLYYTGGKVKHAKRSNNTVINHSDTYTGSGNNARYKSPITESCQKNHIVLFTDGASTNDGNSDADIRALMTSHFSGTNDLAGTGLGFNCQSNHTTEEGYYSSTSCLKDLAFIMNNTDAVETVGGKQIDGTQTIQFHAIGGFLGGNTQTTLDRAAMLGGGISANAQNYEELKTALQKLFDNIAQSGGTFAAPSVSVNAFNSLEQLDQMYYSVFKPHESVGWSGNVKRFRMKDNQIVDAKGNNAIDPDTGFFSADAQSFWTPDNLAPDGDNVTKGGMASRLQDDRQVVSNIVSNNLMANNNRITRSNSNITRQLMGTTLTDASFGGSDVDPSIDSGYTDPYDTNEFTKLVQWVGGNSKTDANKSRRSMEDPLHSTPVLLNYGELTIDGKKVPDSTLFIGTNSGYLHAFDTNENQPKERFAFIPKELLAVAGKYYEGVGEKKYGLDGHISVWHDDTNKDMIINNGEKAYLYVGMRRGGSSYYALDVSDRTAPKLIWKINGKNYQDGPTTGFESLGQTWSKMIPIDIMWEGNEKKALIFSGGYDIAEDNESTRTDHSVGNAIYMVDAKTGDLLWKAGKSGAHLNIPEMKSAIVGDVVPVDDNSDGFVDLLYVADLGGRIFRIDFDNSATTANSYATGGMIADLGKDSSPSEHVRFYNSLDVVYSKAFSYVESTDTGTNMVNGKPRYVLSIGSGYRAHPLDNSATDHFYVLFDYNTEGPQLNASNTPTYTSVTRSSLQKFNLTAAGTTITPSLKTNNGFYVELINAGNSKGGEKVLSDSITLDNTIYFTTFRPSSGTMSSSCAADTGQSRLYKLSLKPGVSSLAVEDINIPGIAPKPVVLMPKAPEDGDDEVDTSPKLLISTQIFDTENSEFPLKKTYWRELKQ